MLRPDERTVLVRLHAPVLALGDDGLIGHADPAALRALGWDATLVGRPTRDVIPQGRLARHKEDYRELARGHWPSDGMSTDDIRPQRQCHAHADAARASVGRRLNLHV